MHKQEAVVVLALSGHYCLRQQQQESLKHATTRRAKLVGRQAWKHSRAGPPPPARAGALEGVKTKKSLEKGGGLFAPDACMRACILPQVGAAILPLPIAHYIS